VAVSYSFVVHRKRRGQAVADQTVGVARENVESAIVVPFTPRVTLKTFAEKV
jgi:hypothetical protein